MSLKFSSFSAIGSLCFFIFIAKLILETDAAHHSENLPRQVSSPRRTPLPSSPGRRSPSPGVFGAQPEQVLRSPWVDAKVLAKAGGTFENVTVLVEPDHIHSFCARSSVSQFCTVSPMEPLKGGNRISWQLRAMPTDVIGKCKTRLEILGRTLITELYVIDSDSIGVIKNFHKIQQQIRERALGTDANSKSDDGVIQPSNRIQSSDGLEMPIPDKAIKPEETIKLVEAEIVMGRNTIKQLNPFYVDFRSDEDIEKYEYIHGADNAPLTALFSNFVYGEVMDRNDKEEKDGKPILLMLNPSILQSVCSKETAASYGICDVAKPIGEQIPLRGQTFNLVHRCIMKLKLGVGSDRPHRIRYVAVNVFDTDRISFGTVLFGKNAFQTFSPLLLDFGK